MRWKTGVIAPVALVATYASADLVLVIRLFILPAGRHRSGRGRLTA